MPDQVDWRALEREASPGRAVGRLLRDQREARGLGLSDVEKSLRIRRAHLEAIEEGRFDKLPGAAYIPAFLRAYAVHVGLDPEKVLTAYHLSGPVPIKRPVALPADFPIVEKRVPIGLAVLTVLLVVAAGYAAWHYLPRDRSVVAEKVPPVPDRLLASRPAASASTDSATPAAAPSAPAAPAQDTRNAAPSLPPEAWPAQRRDSAAAPPPPSAPPAASPPAASPPAASPPTASPSAPPTLAQPQPAPLAPPVVVAAPPPPPPVITTLPTIGQAQAAQPPAAGVDEAVARPPAAEAVKPPARVDTPISVRTNSWVELRAPNGDVLAQTYLRAGETYVVPAGIGYRIYDAR